MFTCPHAPVRLSEAAQARSHRRMPMQAVPLLGLWLAVVSATALLPTVDALAQPGHTNSANWPLTERFSGQSLRQHVYSSSVGSNWIADTDSLWYQWRDAKGTRFHLVIPKQKVNKPLFDHQRMAALLTSELGLPMESANLPIRNLEFTEDRKSITFVVEDVEEENIQFEYNLETGALENKGPRERPRPTRLWQNFSPDSTAYVYAQEHNLFFVDMADEDEHIQLTTDGERWYSFGSRAVGERDDDQEQEQEQEQEEDQRQRRVRPSVTWSPDSKAFFITRSDTRKVEELFLVNSLSTPRPTLRTYKYAMPGDEHVAQIELFHFKRDGHVFRELDVAKWKDQRLFNLHWPDRSDRIRLIRRDRLQRNLELIEINLEDDQIRVLLTESTELGHLRHQNVQYVEDGGDFVWYSRRTGWAQYYLYDHNGRLKNPITTGEWTAEQVVGIDKDRRLIWIRGVAREPGENPYHRHLYRINLNGSGLLLFDPGNADNSTSLSPSRRFVLINASRVDLTPKAIMRDDRAQVVLELEEMDLSKLVETGWQMPETFVVKAADGITDLYGNLYKPFDFDPDKKYPIITSIYPGPQTEQVPTTFSAVRTQQQLAQLGFIVVQIGNRGGSPQRSAAYHSYGYFNLRDYGLADKKAGVEQLAARYPWIDIDRVGIYGHSGGGFMSAAALMVEPYNDFFTVAVSSAGNHDNNVYNQNWSEQHHGLKEVRTRREGTEEEEEEVYDISFEIEVPANHEVAANLKGRLLLVHGDMDNNVHHAGTMRLVRELLRENKRFDLMIFPGMAHGFGNYSSYFNRLMFEYFAEHLLGDYYRYNAQIDRYN